MTLKFHHIYEIFTEQLTHSLPPPVIAACLLKLINYYTRKCLFLQNNRDKIAAINDGAWKEHLQIDQRETGGCCGQNYACRQ